MLFESLQPWLFAVKIHLSTLMPVDVLLVALDRRGGPSATARRNDVAGINPFMGMTPNCTTSAMCEHAGHVLKHVQNFSFI